MKVIKDKVAFLGLGACGSNIALLFQQKQYTTAYLNGSTQDLKVLSGARNILRLKGFDGCGGDRSVAEYAIANNLELIEEIKKIKEEIIYLVFSTAGSTGSGLAPILCDVIEELNETEGFGKTVCCIAVLPRRDEALQKHINSYQCIKELSEKTNIGSCILVDNNKMESLEKINQMVVNQLDYFFRDDSYSAKGNVDVSERLKMIKQPGAMVLSVVCNGKAAKPVEYLKALLTENVFAPVEPDAIVEYIAVINSLERQIDVDMIIDSGYLQQFMEGSSKSPFPQIQLTERPDKAASSLYEGRIAVVVDNSPFVLIIPAVLNVFFQAAEDYYQRWEISSFLRILRYSAGIIAALLPGFYVALTVFQPDMIPTSLALKIAAGRGNVPFPTIIEVLIMELSFELLREAGVRLPSPVSSAIGIVGGIIIGQAAVEAGIVGPTVVIMVALSGICSFVVPNTAMVSAIRVVKYFVLALSSFFGMFGFWIAVLMVLIHLCSLKSFGFPYMYPFCSGSENGNSDFKDSIIRLPVFMMKKRPIFARSKDDVRMKGSGI